MEAAAGDKETEIKGGHAPAQKVGGMRVVQHKHQAEKTTEKEAAAAKAAAEKPSSDEKEEFGEDKPVKPPNSVVVSGAKATEDSAFPKEAVKAYHDKPMPTHDKNASAHQKPKVIQQPCKK